MYELEMDRLGDPSNAEFGFQIPQAGIGFAPKPSPKVRLEMMIAEGHAKLQSEEREKDSQVLPIIGADMAKSIKDAEQMEADLAALRQTLEAQQAPQMMQSQMGLGDMLGVGLSTAFGGAQGFNQASAGIRDQLGQRDAINYKNDSAKFGLERQNAQRSYDELEGSLNEERGNLRKLRQMQLQALMSEDENVWKTAAEKQKHADAIELQLKEDEGRLTLEREKIEGRAKLQKETGRVSFIKEALKGASKEAWPRLMAEMGVGIDDEGFKEAIKQLNTEEQLEVAKAKTEGAKKLEIDSETAINKIKAKYLPQQFKDNHDKARKTIANMQSVIDHRKATGEGDDTSREERLAASSALQSIDRAMDDYRLVAQNARARLNKINDYIVGDPKLAPQFAAEKAELEDTVREAQAGFTDMQAQSKEVRDYLRSKATEPKGDNWLDKAGKAVRGFINMGGTKKKSNKGEIPPMGVPIPDGNPNPNLNAQQVAQAEAAKKSSGDIPENDPRVVNGRKLMGQLTVNADGRLIDRRTKKPIAGPNGKRVTVNDFYGMSPQAQNAAVASAKNSKKTTEQEYKDRFGG